MTDEQNLWFKEAVFYEVNIRAYFDSSGDGNGDIRGLISKLDHIQALGVDCLWILPHYPSPLKDDGYDISDFLGVHPDYGTLDDFRELLGAVHQRGMKIIIELVLNHTSDQHEWFRQARSSRQSPYRDYYVWSDSSDKYAQARIIFLDTEESNWAWDEKTGQFYWHRFYSSQPDLNFDNPVVQEEILNVVKFWLDLGVDGFRVDATPYLFEREGTSCENLPETHAFLKKLRKFVDINHPGAILLSEANQWPEDVLPYFGDGDEMQMNFHFPLMPRMFMALKSQDVTPIKDILARTPEIPSNCQWGAFLRNHDELTLEMVSPEEREWMWQSYAPQARMRLNLGIRRRLAPLLDNDPRKILLASSLLLTLHGSPVIYYGDEIGMGDNIWLDDRDGVRTPMQWDDSLNAGFSRSAPSDLYSPVIDEEPFSYGEVNVARQEADQGSLLHHLRRMISVRKQHPAFGRGEFHWAKTDSTGLAAFWRTYQNERLLLVHNLTDGEQIVDITALSENQPVKAILGEQQQSGQTRFPAFGFTWYRRAAE